MPGAVGWSLCEHSRHLAPGTVHSLVVCAGSLELELGRKEGGLEGNVGGIVCAYLFCAKAPVAELIPTKGW